MISIVMEQSIPYHINHQYQGQTVYWSGSDRKDVWEKNIKSSNNYEYLKSAGWDNEYAIEYKFNSHGFRDAEFDQRDNFIAIGCSFTEGVGLGKDQIWPTKLTNLVGTHVWNLGIGGAAADTCFRILDYYIQVLKPKAVFFLVPPVMRVELHYDDRIESHLANDGHVSNFVKQWFVCEDNGTINRYKNTLAMKQICYTAGVNLYVQDSISNMLENIELARDLLHPGEEYQDYIAKLFYEDFINGNR